MAKVTAKTKKSKSKKGSSRKPVDFEVLRGRINNLVGTKAQKLVESAIAEADKGHFPAMKYLFEMIGLYPTDEAEATPVDDSLAKTLLDRLGFREDSLPDRTGTNDSSLGDTAKAGDTLK